MDSILGAGPFSVLTIIEEEPTTVLNPVSVSALAIGVN